MMSETDWDEVRNALTEMRQRGFQLLKESADQETQVTIAVDVRYQGQGDSITVALGSQLPDQPEWELRRRFEEAYSSLYGSTPSNVEPEILTWRLRVSGPRPTPDIAAIFEGDDQGQQSRPIWFPNSGYVDGAVYHRYSLKPGVEFDGPAVVEERESTVVIGADGHARVDERGNLEVLVDE